MTFKNDQPTAQNMKSYFALIDYNKEKLRETTEQWIKQPVKFYNETEILKRWQSESEFPFQMLASKMRVVYVPYKDNFLSDIMSGAGIYDL